VDVRRRLLSRSVVIDILNDSTRIGRTRKTSMDIVAELAGEVEGTKAVTFN